MFAPLKKVPEIENIIAELSLQDVIFLIQRDIQLANIIQQRAEYVFRSFYPKYLNRYIVTYNPYNWFPVHGQYHDAKSYFARLQTLADWPGLVASGGASVFYRGSQLFYCKTEGQSMRVSSTSSRTSQQPWGDESILSVALNSQHILVLTKQGLYGCGDNRYGQLGMGHTSQLNAFTRLGGDKPPWGDAQILAMATGRAHTLVLTTKGLYACGENRYGQLGTGHTRDLSAFVCLGGNRSLLPWRNGCVLPWGDAQILSIAAGSQHTLVLTTKGLYGCGDNTYGQLGMGNTSQLNIFTLLGGDQPLWRDKTIVSVAAGPFHTLVLATEGILTQRLCVCGANQRGQLGVGHKHNLTTFACVGGNEPLWRDQEIVSIAAGSQHTVLLTTKGLYGCGDNSLGQLGMKCRTGDLITFKHLGLTGSFPWGDAPIVFIAAGHDHTLVLTTKGLYTYGRNNRTFQHIGTLSDLEASEKTNKTEIFMSSHLRTDVQKDASVASSSPLKRSNSPLECLPVEILTRIVKYACNNFTDFVYLASVSHRFQSLITGTLESQRLCTLQKYKNIAMITDISQKHLPVRGQDHSLTSIRRQLYALAHCSGLLAVSNTSFFFQGNQLFGCGVNQHGQLGVGHQNHLNTFMRLGGDVLPWGGASIRSIAASGTHTLLLTTKGLYGCGVNQRGQLGMGHQDHLNTFTRLGGDEPPWGCAPIRSIATGSRHTLVLTTKGLYGCGVNQYGQLGVEYQNDLNIFTRLDDSSSPWGNAQILSIAAGRAHTLVLTTKGLYGCGVNQHGQLGVAHQNYLDIFTRLDHSILPWGSAQILSIAAARDYTLVVTTNGLYVCGNILHGRMMTNTQPLDHVTTFTLFGGDEPPWGSAQILSIAANQDYTLVLTTNGLYCCGDYLEVQNEEQDFAARSTFRPLGKNDSLPWGDAQILSISVGEKHVFILTEKGLYGSGDNSYGQLGIEECWVKGTTSFQRVEVPDLEESGRIGT